VYWCVCVCESAQRVGSCGGGAPASTSSTPMRGNIAHFMNLCLHAHMRVCMCTTHIHMHAHAHTCMHSCLSNKRWNLSTDLKEKADCRNLMSLEVRSGAFIFYPSCWSSYAEHLYPINRNTKLSHHHFLPSYMFLRMLGKNLLIIMRKWPVPWVVSLARAATSIIFVATNMCLLQQNSFVMIKVCLPRQNFCRDKRHVLSWQTHVCRDKSMLVMTKLLSRQNDTCGSSRQWQFSCPSTELSVGGCMHAFPPASERQPSANY